MKKLIATISGISAIGFAVALANTSNIETQANSDASGTDSAQTTTTTTSTTKTCTDDNGVTYYKGHTGFDDCITEMKNSRSAQMSGTVDQSSKSSTSNGDDSTAGKSTNDDVTSSSH